MTNEEYLALSQLGYADLQKDKKISDEIGNIMDTGFPDPILAAKISRFDYTTLADWKIINSENNNATTGFCGSAIQNPDTGEIVFLMRGTEMGVTDHLVIPEDVLTDAQLALPGQPIGDPNQFTGAYIFVKQTIDPSGSMTDAQLATYIQNNKISFTGHSLGGGLCQYLSYITGGESVTFNGVGIGQALDIKDYDDYPITDYVNQDDIIGNFGKQLGNTVYIQGNLITSGVDLKAIAKAVDLLCLMESGLMDPVIGSKLIVAMFVTANEETKEYLENEMNMGAHGLEFFLQEGTQTMKSECNISNTQSFCDSGYKLLKLISKDIKDSGMVDFAKGYPLIIEGSSELIASSMSFIEKATGFINKQTIIMAAEIGQIIESGASETEEQVVNCTQDIVSMQIKFMAGFDHIKEEMAKVLQKTGKDLFEGAVLAYGGVELLSNSDPVARTSQTNRWTQQ